MDLSFRVSDLYALTSFALEHDEGDERSPIFSAVRAQRWIDSLPQGCDLSMVSAPDPYPGVSYCPDSVFFACRYAADASDDTDAQFRKADVQGFLARYFR